MSNGMLTWIFIPHQRPPYYFFHVSFHLFPHWYFPSNISFYFFDNEHFPFIYLFFFLTSPLPQKKVLFLPHLHLFLSCNMFIYSISLSSIIMSSTYLSPLVWIEVNQLKFVKTLQFLTFLNSCKFFGISELIKVKREMK